MLGGKKHVGRRRQNQLISLTDQKVREDMNAAWKCGIGRNKGMKVMHNAGTTTKVHRVAMNQSFATGLNVGTQLPKNQTRSPLKTTTGTGVPTFKIKIKSLLRRLSYAFINYGLLDSPGGSWWCFKSKYAHSSPEPAAAPRTACL